VLAAVVIPNIGQFIGAGEGEARETEFATIQAAVYSMMVDNEISTMPNVVIWTDSATGAENDMGAYPDSMSVGGTADKAFDTGDIAYTAVDDNGYLLQDHDKTGGGVAGPPIDYVSISTASYFYTCEIDGSIRQWETADCSVATGVECIY